MTKYQVIYADPAWPQTTGPKMAGYKIIEGKQIFNRLDNRSQPLSYDTMSLLDIALLPVKQLAAVDAHLYIWVTNQHLPNVFNIINSWGFKYSTTLVWSKKPMGSGLGGSFRISTEFLIFARRGSLKTLENTIGTCYEVKRTYVNGAPKHSLKPDFFHQLIEKTSPGKKIELFARNNREGWDAWGNEVEHSIIF